MTLDKEDLQEFKKIVDDSVKKIVDDSVKKIVDDSVNKSAKSIKQELRAEIQSVESRLNEKIDSVREDLSADINLSTQVTVKEFQKVHARLDQHDTEFKKVHQEILAHDFQISERVHKSEVHKLIRK